jgi:UDP-GlcNAc:undecaprenyl-phosphate/decaprenyl-phosphate GlcNAc-1-phosphate transferase
LPDEARVVGALVVALTTAWALTPVALSVAVRHAFYDHPVGYKAHATPTAYLGGAAVIAGFVVSALIFADGASRFAPILVCALGVSVLGTIDDRFTVRPTLRILGEVVAATVLWAFGLGWSFLESDFEELVLSTVWIVGFTNAFNLMDNMDGAASTVGSVCGAGIAAQAIVSDDVELAALALALSGACLGFLPYNLRRGAPARIFLGDGGSMPIGFIAAALVMSIPAEHGLGWPILLVGALLLAIPVLDTLLVVVSRTRRGVALVTAGRDHLTHRLHARLNSAPIVAATLALAQAVVSLCAILAYQEGRTTIIVVALGFLGLGVGAVALLERPGWVAPGLRLGKVVEIGVDGLQARGDVQELRPEDGGKRLGHEL